MNWVVDFNVVLMFYFSCCIAGVMVGMTISLLVHQVRWM